jgi:hypothetical protein
MNEQQAATILEFLERIARNLERIADFCQYVQNEYEREEDHKH